MGRPGDERAADDRLIAIMFYFMRQMMGANNRNMQFGKTNAKTNEATRPKVKFEDVAGVDEAVEELGGDPLTF